MTDHAISRTLELAASTATVLTSSRRYPSILPPDLKSIIRWGFAYPLDEETIDNIYSLFQQVIPEQHWPDYNQLPDEEYYRYFTLVAIHCRKLQQSSR